MQGDTQEKRDHVPDGSATTSTKVEKDNDDKKRHRASAGNRRQSQWSYRVQETLTPAQESVFLNMQLRKTNRALTGTKTRDTKFEFIALAVLLVIIYSVATLQAQASQSDERDEGNAVDIVPSDQIVVSLTLGQVIGIGVWIFMAVFITSTFRESRFIELLYWMLIYLPLIAVVLSMMQDGFQLPASAGKSFSYFNYGEVIGIFLAVAESLALLIFVSIYYLYPRLINSNWFRGPGKAAAFWRVNAVADWTMTYTTKKDNCGCGQRNTCKYQGGTNEEGRPHGTGRWFDDSYDGEVLTGTWDDGVPVAPFFSRHYGRADVFSAVRIGYVMASDDEWGSTKFWPTNDNAPRWGIASVECSVSGLFYNELPRATHYMGPDVFDAQTSIEEMCNNLIHIGATKEQNMLLIKANDPRGVQIMDHVHGTTGKTYDAEAQEILVKIVRIQEKEEGTSTAPRRRFDFMPRSESTSFTGAEKIVVRDEKDDTEWTMVTSASKIVTSSKTYDAFACCSNEALIEDGLDTTIQSTPKACLRVDNWIPNTRKEVLVLLPGFNSSLEHGLANMGQFIAMTKLDAHVYPILFGWPAGTVATYHPASRASHSDKNRYNFLQLLKSIQNAGVRNVHFLSHSMGAQTLVGSFCDRSDGTRSDVSMCFHLAGDCNDSGIVSVTEEEDHGSSDVLVCKTMTLLNPDFPVSSFVNHAFRSLRRICPTITIVGDKKDGALNASQIMNGIGVYLGYKQPDALGPDQYNKDHLRFQPVIGRSIDSLYLPREVAKDSRHTYLVFQEHAPLVLVAGAEEYDESNLDEAWLDCDVIDTTGLDTNIANIRHSAFNLNPILLNDLEELITTGQRAMQRTSLLYRKGNTFSYCHAPAYVAM